MPRLGLQSGAKFRQHLSKLQREAAQLQGLPRKWVGARRTVAASSRMPPLHPKAFPPVPPARARRRAEVHQQSSEAEDLEHAGIVPEDEEDGVCTRDRSEGLRGEAILIAVT